MRLVNMSPNLNKNAYYFNGDTSVLLQVSPWTDTISLNNGTNGMQYPMGKKDTLSMYEPRYLRVLNYSYDSEEDIPNTNFKMRKYYDGGSL